MLSEADVRLEIDEALKNKGWTLSGKGKNVFTEKSSIVGRADYVLCPEERKDPLVIIEAKRKGKDLDNALLQAQKYAEAFKSPIAYASDGSTIKTIHIKTLKPLILNGEEIDEFVSESLALKFINQNEYNTIGKQVIKSRKELINIFSLANKELRKEGLQAGIERFSEFCNILFLKIFSEEEDTRKEQGIDLRIPNEFNWNNFKNKDGNELLSYVNDTVLKHFQKEYGADIFAPLQLKNPITLKRIIDTLDPLSLVDTKSDIKGDAFEYFLKSYLAKQSKDLGEYFTPRHIIKTLVKLVNPKFGETIYDPFCGTGGMLIEAFRHVYKKMPRNKTTLARLKQETIYGSEITKNAKITKMNMILNGDGHNNIIQQDSLKNPVNNKHDVVITNMPFSLGLYDEYSGLYKLGSGNGDTLCLEHCFNAVSAESHNPRIGIIVPEGILFDKKFRNLREYIYKNSVVKNIISLPTGAFKPYTDVKTSILYLTKVNQNKITQKEVWHYTVKNDGYTLNTKRQKKEGNNDLDVFMSFNGIENENSLLHIGFNKLDLEEIKTNDYISIPNPYKKFEFNSKFKSISLSQLIEECKLKNYQNVNVWSVTNSKGFVLSEDRFDEEVASKNTNQYKIVLQNSFAYNPSRINVGSIALNKSNKIGCVSPMYVVFRISAKNLLNEKYLYWLFQSKCFKKQIKNHAFGSVRQTVKFVDFCKIVIPLPKIDEQKRIIEELESYYQIVKNTSSSTSYWKPYFKIDEGWDVVNLGDITTFIRGIAFEKDDYTDFYQENYIGVVTTKSAQKQGIEEKHLRYVSVSIVNDDKYLKNNDILISLANSLDLVGRTTFVEDLSNPLSFGAFMGIIRANKKYILPKYLFIVLNSDNSSNFFRQNARATTNISNLNFSNLKKLSIPLPPIHIQQKIVEQIEQEHKMIDSQKEIVKLFETKIQDKLNSLWQSEEEHYH